MKMFRGNPGAAGLTRSEVIVIIGVTLLVVFVGFFGLTIPALRRGKAKAQRVRCVFQLHEIGVGFHSWSDDHNNELPWGASSRDGGGTLEFVSKAAEYRHFLIASNELKTPKILVCPSDASRIRSQTWDTFASDANLSYFIGLDANYALPSTLLTGDRNIEGGNRSSGNTILIAAKQASWGVTYIIAWATLAK